MALNTRLANLVSTSTDLASLGASVISLSSQILEKGMMYISGEKPERGISGFMLDVVKETVVEMNSDITDYPLEMDYQVQSHFARRPVMINVTGVCSDIRVHDPNDEWNLEALLDDLTEMVEKINMISQRLNMGATVRESARVVAFMKTIHTLYGKVKETYNRVKKVMKLLGKDFGEKDKTSSQINAYETLKEMWKSGRELKVETPWEVYEHCVIESLSFTQPEETNQQTNINIRFKQLTLTTVNVGLFGTKIDSKVAQQLAKKSVATNDKETVEYEGFIHETGRKTNVKLKEMEQKQIKNQITNQGGSVYVLNPDYKGTDYYGGK